MYFLIRIFGKYDGFCQAEDELPSLELLDYIKTVICCDDVQDVRVSSYLLIFP